MSISATSEATGYPADNMLSPRIARPWRSTSTAQQQIIIDLGADTQVESVWIQSTNAPSADVEKKLAVGSYISVGTLSIYEEPTGRRKGWLAVPGTYRYLRYTIAAGTPVDGAAYWEIGAIYVFSGLAQLSVAPQWGVNISSDFPQTTQLLANGRNINAVTGSSFSKVELRFVANPTVDVAAVLREARSNTVGFSIGDSSRPWNAWPVRAIMPSWQSRIDTHYSDSHEFVLQEQV